MEPAKSIIAKLGGPNEVAGIAGVHRTRVYDWLRTGTIPFKHVPKLIAAAKAKGKKLTADNFLPRVAA